MEWLVVAAGVIVLVVVVIALSRRGKGSATSGPATAGTGDTGSDRLRPAVADFRVADGAALVYFEVPLGEGDDPVLGELLGREAIEVVREKRHQLPIDDVNRVVAFGRRGSEWAEAARISLETPGTLPPPLIPEAFAHARRPELDLFDRFTDMPAQAPGLADRVRGEELAPLSTELRFPGLVAAGLRSQGIDPNAASAGDIVLGVMRVAGYQVSEIGPDTYTAMRGGQRTFVRVIGHAEGEHPELGEQAIRTFVVDFGSSGADRGLLITEKYGPFEVYDRERRDKRVRFVTRERLQGFVDALSVS